MGGWCNQITNQNSIATLPCYRRVLRSLDSARTPHHLCAASLRDSRDGVQRPFKYPEAREASVMGKNNVADWAHALSISYNICIRIVYIYRLGSLSCLSPKPSHLLPTPRAGPEDGFDTAGVAWWDELRIEKDTPPDQATSLLRRRERDWSRATGRPGLLLARKSSYGEVNGWWLLTYGK
jgi:hypothetical protein